MFLNKPAEKSSTIAEQASQSVDQVLKATQQVSSMAHRGMDSVRETSHQLRVKADRASENTVSLIRQEPVKSVLIAAATGAALMALVSFVSRSRDRY
jgi:ElaB/YqjD/DUF883 family membrane-anchored ribosome-binding protein